MNNRSYEQFLVIQAKIDANKQETDGKQMKTDQKLTQLAEDLKVLTLTITSMMDQNNNSKFSPSQKGTLDTPDPTNMVPANRRAPPLDEGHSTKIGCMWTLKYEISSPKFYELIIKT